MTPPESEQTRQWFIVRRWQEFGGETRACLMRILAITGFYCAQLIHYMSLTVPNDPEQRFHRYVTMVAAAWAFAAVSTLLCLRKQFFPSYLPFVTTIIDLGLLTMLAALGSGPNSPLTRVYFLIIVLSAIRFNLPLIWCATIGSLAGYMSLVGLADDTWFDPNHAVPPIEQLVTVLALGLTGLFIGQIIRRVPQLAFEFERRMNSKREMDAS
ncbi:MAG: hypothetical protein ACI9HK_005688 [Pirellulaceae bacterium]|jgi:hypothetical protein